MPEGDKPGIFISHTGADAPVANELGRLIRRVFAGAIIPWYSSDKSPRGGIKPGEPWWERIHDELRGAAQVFALVTPRSVNKPWIYWESGIGSMACQGKVTAVVFRMKIADLAPPLSYFEGIDGLDPDSLNPGICKVGDAADLAPDTRIETECVAEFVELAEGKLQGVEAPETGHAADPIASLYGPLQNMADRLERIERQLERHEQVVSASPELHPRAIRDALHGVEDAHTYLRSRLERALHTPGQVFGALYEAALSDRLPLSAVFRSFEEIIGPDLAEPQREPKRQIVNERNGGRA